MNKIVLLIFIAFLSREAMAFEAGQLSLDTPNVLKQGEGSFGIRHRFYGEIDDLDTFFGTDLGGDMHFMLKYALLDNLVLGVDHTRTQSAYGIGLEYSYDFNWIKAGLRVNGFRLNLGNDQFDKSYMSNFSLQTANILDHLILTLNTGYDAYNEHQIFGVGADLNANNFLTFLTFTEKVSIVAEYYPLIDEIEGLTKKYDSFAVGLKFQTYGHHFELMTTNSSNMDPRTMSIGTNSDKLHFGFNINRKF